MEIPKNKRRTRSAITRYEAKVLEQMLLRVDHRGEERSTGNAEAVLDFVGGKLTGRTAAIGNLRRLETILGLIRLHLSNLDRAVVYTGIVRAYFRDHGGPSGLTRKAYAGFYDDPGRANSIDRLVGFARARNAAIMVGKQDALSAQTYQNAKETSRANALAEGRPPPDRKRRQRISRPVGPLYAGRFVADVPQLRETWDHEANDGLDPTTVPLGSNKPRQWRCLAHADDPEHPHVHRWPRSPADRLSSESGCPTA